MDSGDDVTMALPSDRTAIDALTESAAPAPVTANEDEQAGSNEVSESPSTGNITQEEAGQVAAAAVSQIDVTNESSRSSSPLSGVDEDILQTDPTTNFRQSAPNDGTIITQAASNTLGETSSGPSALLTAIDGTSSIPAAASPKPNGKRTRAAAKMQDAAEPPTKRRRGRPPKNSVKKDSMSPEDTDKPVADQLALDIPPDSLQVRPTKKALLGGAKSSRYTAKTRGRNFDDDDDDEDGYVGSARLRQKQAQAEDENYEPLHLYEKSNWVLFDPLKAWPPGLPFLPEFLKPFTHYKRGNGRVLEYNLVSNSVRLKSTPKVLKGKSVKYGSDGPRFK